MSAALPDALPRLSPESSGIPLARMALPLSTRAALAGLLARHRILLLPGWKDSGPWHWQTLWQQEFPAMERVAQRDWLQPDPDAWVNAFDEHLRASRKPAVVVAHSLGCITVARWVAQRARSPGQAWPLAGALLVAPADVERESAPPPLRPFAPIARVPLPFSGCVVASSNDPCCREETARSLASAWRARCVVLPDVGHINADSGLGNWPHGLSLLAWMGGG